MTIQAKAPPIQRLEHWTLVASDVERTKRWFVDVLGAEVPDRNGPTCVDLAGTIVDIFPTGGDRAPMPGSGGQHHAYIIRLDDFDPWEAHFKAVGQQYRRTTHGMGRISLYVDDPDGYHIELTVPFDNLEEGRREIEKRGLLEEALKPPPSFVTRTGNWAT
jgi:catechol 2,3-dioxygenase-like lactoylglutathione lyase family enzyme